MPQISQGLTVPPNIQSGGTVQAADVGTLYTALNAFNLPGTVGVFQQGFVDNNSYTSTAGSFVDWTLSTSLAANKAVFILAPVSWTGSTAGTNLIVTPRINAASATTSTGLTFAQASSGQALVAAFIGPRSNNVQLGGFYLAIDQSTASSGIAIRSAGLSSGGLGTSTAAITSVGFMTSTAGAGNSFVWSSVRVWIEG